MKSGNGVHKLPYLLEIAKKSVKEKKYRGEIIDFGRNKEDVRFYRTLYSVTGVEGDSPTETFFDGILSKEQAHEMIQGIQTDVTERLNSIEGIDSGLYEFPDLSKGPPHNLKMGQFYINEISLLFLGSKVQDFHFDADITKAPKKLREMVKKKKALSLGFSGEYPLDFEKNESKLYLMEGKFPYCDPDMKHVKTMVPGVAGVFPVTVPHAGGTYSHLGPRLHFHIDVCGFDRSEGVDRIQPYFGVEDEGDIGVPMPENAPSTKSREYRNPGWAKVKSYHSRN